MCGLCGVMSTWISDPEVETFRELMVLNTLRGSEGAGIVAVAQGKSEVHALKTDASGADLVMSAPFYKLMQQRRKLIIGHCRLPTKGSTELDDIHPHKADHIYGVHNGTLWQVGGKPVPEKTSDSLMLFRAIAKEGLVKTIEQTKGAYALIWLNEKDRTLNFLRNTDRPLFFGWPGTSMTPGTLYWSSEKGMLEFILKRRYAGEVTTKEFSKDTWMRYDLDGITNTIHFKDQTEVKQKTEHKEWDGWRHGWEKDEKGVWRQKPPFEIKEDKKTFTPLTAEEARKQEQTRTGTRTDTTSTAGSGRITNIRDIINERKKRRMTYHIPNEITEATVYETQPNNWVQKGALNRYLQSGCQWCGQQMDFKDYMEHRLCFSTATEYYCSACIIDPTVNDLLN